MGSPCHPLSSAKKRTKTFKLTDHEAPHPATGDSFILWQYPESYDEDDKKEEQTALLKEAARIRQEETKNTILWFAILLVIFGSIMSGLVYMASNKNLTTTIGEKLDEHDSIVRHWKETMGIEECHRLARRHITVHNDVGLDNTSSFEFNSPAVFFVMDEADLTLEQACSLESFVLLLADLMVYSVHLRCKGSSQGTPKNKYKTALAETYKNLLAVNIEGHEFFEGTPSSGRWRCGNRLALEEAMLLMIWRFGGLAVHPGIALARRTFINFPAGQIQLSEHYVVSHPKCAPPIYYLLTYFASRVKEGESNLDVAKAAHDLFEALCCSGVCLNVITGDTGQVCDNSCPLLTVTNVTQIKQLCPKTMKVLDDSIRISGKAKTNKQAD